MKKWSMARLTESLTKFLLAALRARLRRRAANEVDWRATASPIKTNMSEISTKPYMLRAIYEWCTDSGFTPYLAVKVDASTTVPLEFVKKGEIVLNISYGATSGLKMDNDAIHFRARFGGVSREIYVPVHNVLAIYANENGQGMAFEVTTPSADGISSPASKTPDPAPQRVPSAVPSPAPALASVPSGDQDAPKPATPAASSPDGNDEPPKKGGRPTLTVIK
jgi:stringent starvation protein B